MRSQRILLLAVAAAIGMIAPSTANATRPSPTPTASQLAEWPRGRLGQHGRPRRRALRHRVGRRQDLARRSEDRRGHDLRQRSAEVDHRHRRHDRRRVHRLHRLCAGHRRRPRRRRQRRRRHLPDRRPAQLHRDRRHRRVRAQPTRRGFRSTSQPGSSTRSRPTGAGSWSPMGTTTASTGSPVTAMSAR